MQGAGFYADVPAPRGLEGAPGVQVAEVVGGALVFLGVACCQAVCVRRGCLVNRLDVEAFSLAG